MDPSRLQEKRPEADLTRVPDVIPTANLFIYSDTSVKCKAQQAFADAEISTSPVPVPRHNFQAR